MGQRQAAPAAPSMDWDQGVPPVATASSPVERGLHVLVSTFYQYARVPPGGGEPILDPPSFQLLLQRELGHQLTGTGHPQAVAAIFQSLGKAGDRGDRGVTFTGYWQLLTWICHVLRHRHYGDTPPPPAPGGTPQDGGIDGGTPQDGGIPQDGGTPQDGGIEVAPAKGRGDREA